MNLNPLFADLLPVQIMLTAKHAQVARTIGATRMLWDDVIDMEVEGALALVAGFGVLKLAALVFLEDLGSSSWGEGFPGLGFFGLGAGVGM